MALTLYSYWRSSAAYRVRIALNLKGIDYEVRTISLAPGVNEHRKPKYSERNPQMLIPFLEDGDVGFGQSQAILEYLEERYPSPPLLPRMSASRAMVRSFCNSICCDIHPLNNLRVLTYLKEELGVKDASRVAWYDHWISEGFRTAEIIAASHSGPFVFGESVTLADCCLVPQVYNARRFNVSVDAYPALTNAVAHCLEMPGFIKACPEKQPDAMR